MMRTPSSTASTRERSGSTSHVVDERWPADGALQPGDRLHVLVRHEVADDVDELIVRWRTGPVERPGRPRFAGLNAPIFCVRPWNESDGDAAAPEDVDGVPVVERLRTRRDIAGALLVLADGRYAVTGPVVACGGARAVELHARRRLGRAQNDSERAWWQEVLGAVAMEGREAR